jgi:hypothetical protein
MTGPGGSVDYQPPYSYNFSTPDGASATANAAELTGAAAPTGGTNYAATVAGQPATVNVSNPTAINGTCQTTETTTVNAKQGTTTVQVQASCTLNISQGALTDFYNAIGSAVTSFANAITTAIGACETIASAVGNWFMHLFGNVTAPVFSQDSSGGMGFSINHEGAHATGTTIDNHFSFNHY